MEHVQFIIIMLITLVHVQMNILGQSVNIVNNSFEFAFIWNFPIKKILTKQKLFLVYSQRHVKTMHHVAIIISGGILVIAVQDILELTANTVKILFQFIV